jgi:hypothetical protein
LDRGRPARLGVPLIGAHGRCRGRHSIVPTLYAVPLGGVGSPGDCRSTAPLSPWVTDRFPLVARPINQSWNCTGGQLALETTVRSSTAAAGPPCRPCRRATPYMAQLRQNVPLMGPSAAKGEVGWGSQRFCGPPALSVAPLTAVSCPYAGRGSQESSGAGHRR